ncbi:MAG: aminopeptidase P family protein [Anaerotignum sp.]|nr:aminopeptidase P family protein [Anaerotignum sp.]
MEQNVFAKNREKLLGRMADNAVAVLFAGQAPYKRGDEKYPFSPDRNFYYVTGIDQEDSILLLAQTEADVRQTLFIRRDNGDLAKWVGANMEAKEAQEISGIMKIAYIDEFEREFAEVVFKNNLKTVCLDLENRDWNADFYPALKFAQEVQKRYPSMQIEDLYPVFGDLRLIKEEWELERMRKAMDITRLGIEEMMRQAKAGMKEYEVEAHFDYILTKNGVRQKAFQTIVAGGRRGTILHYAENNQPVCDGELILIDAGAQVDWYNGDISRTFPINGKFSQRQKLVYHIVLEGQKKVIDAIRPGVPFSDLNEILKEHYFHALREIGLVEKKEDVAKYYYHGVSHYLGAETHDIGRYIKRDLQPGMVLTVEPGLYIEEWEIGIRIEDDVLVTEDGCEVMTAAMIKTVEEIEAFMAKGE